MRPFLREHKRSIALVLIISGAFAALLWIQYANNAVRAEARERFFEQYNRQQYLVAELGVPYTADELLPPFTATLTWPAVFSMEERLISDGHMR